MKKYIVRLEAEERRLLEQLVRTGKSAAYRIRHANILLAVDASEAGPGMKDADAAVAFHVRVQTIESLRRRWVEEGTEAALGRRQRAYPAAKMFDGEKEARLIAIACGPKPEGRTRWTLELLADQAVALKIVEHCSPQTVMRLLKKNELKPWQHKMWCIPPKSDGEFVCAMENVLAVYQRPLDADHPVVCFDEKSKQLVGEVATPIPAAPGRAECHDYEYVRNGTANLFMLVEPLRGWRHVSVTSRRTKLDFAGQMKELVDTHYAKAKKITLVMDNLNTHRMSCLYEAFAPTEARRIIEKIEVVHTPKHGSWLNMAECELSVLEKQCLGERIADEATLWEQVSLWNKDRNQRSKKIDWQFKTPDARIKLHRLYPQIQME